MTKQDIEDEFQDYLKLAYGRTMLDKSQMIELKLAFAAGMAVSFNRATHFLESDNTNSFHALPIAILEYGLEVNRER